MGLRSRWGRQGPSTASFQQLKALIERVEPVLVSKHLAWSAIGGAY